MFKIYPLSDEILINKYLSICNIKRRADAFTYAMCDIESGELMGIAQFEIYDGYAMIFDISEAPTHNDFEAMFILARQTMNFIEKCGITDCRAQKDAADAAFLAAVGFKPNEDGYSVNLTGMFDGNCKGHS